MWLLLNDNFLLHLKCSEDQFNFYISNLLSMWHTQMSCNAVVKQFKELNPMFEMKESVIIEKITDLFSKAANEGCHKVEISSNNCLTVRSTNAIKGFTYKMEITLDPARQDDLFSEFTTSLIYLLRTLKEKEKELVSIIEAKDVELEEYRLEGVELKRRGIITAPFSYETFLKSKVELPSVSHPIDLLKGPLQEMLGTSPKTIEAEEEVKPVPVVTKKEKQRVVADVKSISGTAGCLYSAKPDVVKSENVRKRKIPARVVRL